MIAFAGYYPPNIPTWEKTNIVDENDTYLKIVKLLIDNTTDLTARDDENHSAFTYMTSFNIAPKTATMLATKILGDPNSKYSDIPIRSFVKDTLVNVVLESAIRIRHKGTEISTLFDNMIHTMIPKYIERAANDAEFAKDMEKEISEMLEPTKAEIGFDEKKEHILIGFEEKKENLLRSILNVLPIAKKVALQKAPDKTVSFNEFTKTMDNSSAQNGLLKDTEENQPFEPSR